MAEQKVGTLYTEVEARLTKLEGQLRDGERRVKASAERMKRESSFDFGAVTGVIGARGMFTGIEVGAKGATIVMAALKGEVEEVREGIFNLPFGLGQMARAVDDFAASLENLESYNLADIMLAQDKKRAGEQMRRAGIDRRGGLMGEAGLVGLEGADLQRAQVEQERRKRIADLIQAKRAAMGNGIDLRRDFQAEADLIDQIADGKLADINRKDAEQRADKEEREKEAAMRERDQALKLEREKAEALFDLRDRNDVMELKQRDEVAASRLEIERDTERQIRDAKAAGNFALIPEIERERRLRLEGTSGRAEQIDITRMAFGRGDGLRAAAEKELPKIAKSSEEQTGVLRSLLNAVTKLQFGATTSN